VQIVIELLLNSSVSEWGIHQTITQVIISFLDKTGITSYKDSSCETHFAVTAMRRKIIAGIESHTHVEKQGEIALLFLPPNEHYDLILLYMNYILCTKGRRVLYLRTVIILQNSFKRVTTKKPSLLCTYVPELKKEHHKPVLRYIVSQKSQLPFCLVSDMPDNTGLKNIPHFHFVHYKHFDDWGLPC